MVAARRRGFTPCEVEVCGTCDCGCGVFVPVPMGVERLDGSSEVNIVAEDGDIRYFVVSDARRASLKPSPLCEY